MPMPKQLKNLHLANCVEELQDKASIDPKDFKTINTDRLCKSAEKLLLAARDNHMNGDEELAFVYYFKFVDLVVFLKQRKNFSSTGKYERNLVENVEGALELATQLKASLAKRYAALKEANTVKENENAAVKDQNVVKQVQEDVKEEKVLNSTGLVIDTTPDHSIAPAAVLALMRNPESTFIIMDIRSSREFNDSHIKHDNCINIPAEVLVPGMTARHLEEKLPQSSLCKWMERNIVGHVILVDWDTTDTCLPNGHPLQTVEHAMCKWDMDSPLVKPPLILSGGYKEWMIHYPMYTTKALDVFALEQPQQKLSLYDVSGVDYPSLDEDEPDVLSMNKKNRRATALIPDDPLNNQAFVNGWATTTNFRPQSVPNVNRTTKPVVSRSESSTSSELYNSPGHSSDRAFSSPTSHESDTNVKSKIPEVKRSLKPNWIPTTGLGQEGPASQEGRRNDIINGLSRQENAMNENIDIAERQLSKEREFDELRARKELEAEESKRMELQKREEQLLENIKLLENQSKEKEEEWQKLKKENMRMKRVLEEKEEDLRIEKIKQLQAIESRNAYIKQSIDSLRRQRKIDEQRMRREKEESRTDSGKENIVSSGQRDDDRAKKAKYPSESEYTIPLKLLESSSSSHEASSRGLTRSYSSPNIAQMVADEAAIDVQHKLPTIDRSLKPKADHTFNNFVEVSSLRMRNFNPTYGNCPARPVTGLKNLGNTCYMNSTIQCLSNTEQFANYFYTGRYRSHIRRNNKHSTNGEVSEEFAAIIIALWAGQYKSISPKDFKAIASKHIPMCIGSEQQDSHEFLVVLMDKLHSDFNQGHNTDPLPNLESLPESIATEKFWSHHLSRNRSKISETFEGLLRSKLSCLSCGQTSNSYEVFSCLSLPISSTKCFLQDCLKTFLKPEKMSGEAAWGCPSCKQKREAEKSLVFCKLPDVLIIQLKRFSYEGLWRSKIQAYVEFPTNFEMPCNSKPRTYSLYGIVNHFGYLEGGHYTACCKNPSTGRWYKYDDSDVSEISSCDIHTSAAYLLFYSAVGGRT